MSMDLMDQSLSSLGCFKFKTSFSHDWQEETGYYTLLLHAVKTVFRWRKTWRNEASYTVTVIRCWFLVSFDPLNCAWCYLELFHAFPLVIWFTPAVGNAHFSACLICSLLGNIHTGAEFDCHLYDLTESGIFSDYVIDKLIVSLYDLLAWINQIRRQSYRLYCFSHTQQVHFWHYAATSARSDHLRILIRVWQTIVFWPIILLCFTDRTVYPIHNRFISDIMLELLQDQII